jgi:hypothetical protein
MANEPEAGVLIIFLKPYTKSPASLNEAGLLKLVSNWFIDSNSILIRNDDSFGDRLQFYYRQLVPFRHDQ